jgi:hypothetical protein
MAEVALPIMATPAVGEDIDALCGKCGQVWHVVMAKVGERIAKVVCKRCGGQHLYRTEQVGEAAASGDRPVSGAKRPLRSRTPEPPALPVPAFDPNKAPRPYSALEAFTAGDRVVHTTFGTGVVTGSPGPGKVEIAFTNGRRVLASAKQASTLERPRLARHVPISDRPPEKAPT